MKALFRSPVAFCSWMAAAFVCFAGCGRAQQFNLGSPEVVSEARVDRTVFEYTMRARLTNQGARIAGLSGSVTSTSPRTVIVSSVVNFGDVPANLTSTSENTFTIRHDRTVPFDPAVLKWTLTAPPVTPVLAPLSSPTAAAGVTVTGTAGPGDSIEISGGVAPVTATASATGTFSVSVALQPNRLNRLYVSSINATAQRSATVPLEVIQDGQPPSLFIDFPTANAELTNDSIVVAGRVGDMLSGFMGLSVSANGEAANVVTGIGQNGSFERAGVPLVMGANTLAVTATDVNGNTTSKQITVTRVAISGPRMTAISGDGQAASIHARLANPIVVKLTHPDGSPFSDKMVTFDVTRSDGRLAASPLASEPEPLLLQIPTEADGTARVWWWMGGDAGCGNNRISVTSRDIAGTTFFCATARPAPARQINIGSGNNQRGEAGAPAMEPLRAWVNDSCNGVAGIPVTFTVTQGGGKVNGLDVVTLNSSITGHAQVAFTLGPEGGNHLIEATFPGNPGVAATFVIFGVNRDLANPTTFSGLVLDNASAPVGGALCALVAANGQTFTTRSNTQGQFLFNPATLDPPIAALPSGPAQLHVDGLVATLLNGQTIPAGSYPALSYSVVLVPNAGNSLPTPVLLPRLNPNNAKNYNGTTDLVLTCEGMAGLKMTIKAGSMRKADDSLVSPANPARVSLNQVHHDDVPMPLPDGAAPPFAWTLQPGGARFDPPVQIEYPNMGALPPGAIANFLTYNHDTERFEIVASGQVTDDGSTIVSDAGAGLIISGWGCNCPPYSVTAKCCKEPASGCKACVNGRLVNQPDGTPADDNDPWTINDKCVGGIAVGTPPGGDCTLGPPVYTANFPTTMNAAGGNTATMQGIEIGRDSCYDAATRSFKLHVNSIGIRGQINLTMAGSTEPNPVVGGNVTAANYCSILATMRGYSSAGGGRGAWHSLAASRAHEEHHRDVDFKNIFLARWSTASSILDGLTVSCAVPGGQSFLMAQASALISQLEADVLKDLGTFNATHNNQTTDGAYLAGQAELDRIIQNVQAFATAQGFPPCGAPGPIPPNGGGDGPRLQTLGATTTQTTLFIGQQGQITVTGGYQDGSSADLTQGSTGTLYQSSDPMVVSVGANGSIQAIAPGSANVLVSHSPGLDLLPLTDVIRFVVASPEDRDADGMPDAWETSFGLNPDDSADAGGDNDLDGLSNLTEFMRATNPTDEDTDGDGLNDGLEANNGEDPLFPPVLDENWQVNVNGQPVQVDRDGTFTIPNVSASDQFGPGGPGTAPDFLADDFVRLTGQRSILGLTFYVFSEPFQFRQGQTYLFGDLTITSSPPPLASSIAATLDVSTLTAIGQTTQVRVTATLSGGATADVTPRTKWTVYRTSNPAIAEVGKDGLITATGRGIAYITAVNEGTTSVVQINVAPGDPLTTVSGWVRDGNGLAVPGVTVRIAGLGGTSLTDTEGRFAIAGVPATFGMISVTAQLILPGGALVGRAVSVTPTGGGITDAGLITLKPAVAWVGAASGSWSTANNWSTGALPGPTADVFISTPGNVVITHASGTNTVQSLYSDNPVVISGGTLTVLDFIQANSTFTLSGSGTVKSAIFLRVAGAPAINATGGTLDGVTLAADLAVAANSQITVRNGLGLSQAQFRLNGNATAVFNGSQTLGGSGEVVFAGAANATSNLRVQGAGNLAGAAVFTIGTGITVHGSQNGTILAASAFDSIVNMGTVSPDTAGRTITLSGALVTNHGTMQAINGGNLVVTNLVDAKGLQVTGGGALTLNGTWVNSGTITAANSTVNFDGNFTPASLGTFNRTDGTVNVTGLLDLTGTTLALNASTGSWNLTGSGTIKGGTITSADGARLVMPANAAGTMDGVTLGSDFLNDRGTLTVVNGLTFANNATLTVAAGPSYNAAISFNGTQTLGGTGTLLIAGTQNTNFVQIRGGNSVATAATLTLGSGVTVRHAPGSATVAQFVSIYAQDRLINLGTISAESAGRTLTVNAGGGVTNQGIMRAIGGGSLTVVNLADASGLTVTGGGALTLTQFGNTGEISATDSTLTLNGVWSNAGIITAVNSTVNFDGSFPLASLGTFNRTGGTVNVTGLLDLTGTALALNASTGSWNLTGSGTIKGGTITSADGARLVMPANAAGTMDGVTLGSDFLNDRGTLTVINGLTLANNATLTVAAGPSYNAAISFNGTQTLGGTGTLLIAGTQNTNFVQIRGGNSVATAATLTVGAGVTVRHAPGSATVAQFVSIYAQDRLINLGTISAESAGRTLTVNAGGGVTNQGIMRAIGGNLSVVNLADASGLTVTGGGALTLTQFGNTGEISATDSTLTLNGVWSNAGIITAVNSTVNFDGSFPLASLGTFNRTGGTVNVTGLLDLTGTALALNASTGSWNLTGSGTIKGGTITSADGARLVMPANAAGTMDGVTLGSDFLNDRGTLTVVNGLTFANNATLTVAAGPSYNAAISFNGTQTLGGTGTLLIAGTQNTNFVQIRGGNSVATAATLTVGAGVTVRHAPGSATVAQFVSIYAQDRLINLGTISAESAGRTLTVNAGGGVTNQGIMRAIGGNLSVVNLADASGLTVTGGGALTLTQFGNTGEISATDSTLTLNGVWSNAGIITAVNSTVNFDGSFPLASLGTFNRTGGTVNVTGLLDLTGTALALNASTGSWNLTGSGTIKGGTITSADGARLVMPANAAGTMDGVTLGSDFLNDRGTLTVVNGLTFANNATLTVAAGPSYNAAISFNGTQTLGGTGTLLIAGTQNTNFVQIRGGNSVATAATLTVGAGVTVRHAPGSATVAQFVSIYAQDRLINLGTISAESAGRTLTVNAGGGVTNQGIMRAIGGNLSVVNLADASGLTVTGGGTLTLTQFGNTGEISATDSTLTLNGVWSNAGIITAVNSTVNFDGSFPLASLGTFNRTGGTVNVTGLLDLTGTALALNASTGSWNLTGSGTIKGGTITSADGARLVMPANAAGTMDGVTLGSDFLNDRGTLTVVNGLTFANNATLTVAAGPSYNAAISFNGTQTLGGTGTLLIAGTQNTNFVQIRGGNSVATAATLTLGSGVTVRHAPGSATVAQFVSIYAQDRLINLGTISAESAGRTLTVNAGGGVTNQGIMRAIGGTLSLSNLAPNAGVIQAGIGGTVAIAGALDAAAGTVGIDFGGTAANQFGRLTVSGAATLSGNLNLTLLNGFNPDLGNSFQVVSFASGTGQFNEINGRAIGVGKEFSPVYSATNLTLNVIAGAGVGGAAPSPPTTVDTDGDGATDDQERLAGTDPLDSSNTFRIAAIQRTALGIEFRFATVAGRTYQLEFSPDLSTGSWKTIGTPMAGTGGTLEIVDAAPMRHGQRFYRIAVTGSLP